MLTRRSPWIHYELFPARTFQSAGGSLRITSGAVVGELEDDEAMYLAFVPADPSGRQAVIVQLRKGRLIDDEAPQAISTTYRVTRLDGKTLISHRVNRRKMSREVCPSFEND